MGGGIIVYEPVEREGETKKKEAIRIKCNAPVLQGNHKECVNNLDVRSFVVWSSGRERKNDEPTTLQDTVACTSPALKILVCLMSSWLAGRQELAPKLGPWATTAPTIST
jgi:hypothetical protein